jgi:hypothetical protein
LLELGQGEVLQLLEKHIIARTGGPLQGADTIRCLGMIHHIRIHIYTIIRTQFIGKTPEERAQRGHLVES